MSATSVLDVQDQVQKFWAPMFMDELRETALLPSLVNRAYEGEIKKGGDTVYVSQINKPTGENRTVGTNADSFATEQLSLSRVDVKADKRAVAAYEFEDLAQIQSQLESQDSEIRRALVDAVNLKINEYLYGLVAPSASAPDHLINSITDFNASQVAAARLRAAAAKWERSKGWWILADPSYYSDLLNASTLTSSDYGATDAPVIGGQIVNKRMGFNILEDNTIAVDQALVFHPDFLYLVMQQMVQFKISDLHSQKKFGYIISADLIYGAKLGIQGAVKHQVVTASASATGITVA